jgi:hypothetical protein
MKVKLFKADNSTDLESVINDWLNNAQIEIINISYSSYIYIKWGVKKEYSALVLYRK